MPKKIIIGKEEWCALPELGLPAVKARVASGVQTSSLHAYNIQPFEEDGKKYVHFDIHPVQKNRRYVQSCRGVVVDKREITDIKGHKERRIIIRTPVTLGDKTWDVELALTSSENSGYRMVLGREAMSNKVLIDPDENLRLGDVSPEDLKIYYGTPRKKKAGLRIVVLASDPEAYSSQRLMEAGEDRGHSMSFVDLSECYMNVSAEQPAIYYRGGQLLDRVDAVIPRIEPSVTFYGCSVTRQFQTLGTFCLNDSVSIARSRDKLRSLQLLSVKGIPMPITGFAKSPKDTSDVIQMVGGAPVIVKLLEGMQGVGVVLAETQKAAESVVNAFKSLDANILVQEYIKEAEGRDLRCFVIDGKVVGSMQRVAMEGDFRANLHLGGKAEAIKITAEERKIAIQAAKIMGLKVAGVDIIRSKDGPKVLEINSSPGLAGIEEVTGKDIAGMMIECIERNYK